VAEDYAPPRLPGNRPTIDAKKPNHREMTFPLMPQETVVFRHPVTNEVLTGEIMTRADDEHDKVSILYLKDNKMDVVKNVNLGSMRVVRTTDYLIYGGARFFVFGPPANTVGLLTWGSAWLDVVAEHACLGDEDRVAEKMLYELRRLQLVMLGYPGLPDCPVLVLGFLQGNDDSDWKAIGLLECDNDDIVEDEKTAFDHICFVTMTDLRKDYATTRTIVVDQELELWMTTHPSVMMYHKAMNYIEKWSKNMLRWLPAKTWKARVTSMHAKNSKAASSRAQEAKPCVQCQATEKQVAKINVSPLLP
jgi:hypothetical protein